MTKQEIMKAFEMRLDGYSYYKIGGALNYNYSTIRDNIYKVYQGINSNKLHNLEHKYAYPNIANHIRKSYPTIKAFTTAHNIHYGTLLSVLKGGDKLSPKLLVKLVQRTGEPAEWLSVEGGLY